MKKLILSLLLSLPVLFIALPSQADEVIIYGSYPYEYNPVEYNSYPYDYYGPEYSYGTYYYNTYPYSYQYYYHPYTYRNGFVYEVDGGYHHHHHHH